MSYVDGDTLAARVRDRGPVSATDGIRLLREVAWALAYAHAQGVVHRDVKPDNILIESATGRALVADFGIAAVNGDVASRDGALAGTPEFMSPEQALGKEIDARSDLYALGVTAFYAFSGRVPFEGESPTEILARQVTEAPASLASLGLAVPRAVASLVDRCLAKEPADRPASAELLAEQLGATSDQRRELPAPLRAFVRRNGRIDGGGTLLYAAGLLLGSVGLSMAVSAPVAFTTFIGGAVLAPVAYGVAAARRLLRLGFARADLAPAFQCEIESAREERAVEHVQRRGPERVVSAVAKICGSFSVIAVPTMIASLWFPAIRGLAAAAAPATLFTTLLGGASGIAWMALVQQRRDIDTEIWSSLWMGQPGVFAFALARMLRGRRPAVAAMTHRATELSLGLAAEDLYESLQKSARRELGDVPEVLRRLQRDAQQLRARYAQLDAAVGSEGATGDSPDVAALREERDLVHDKLSDAVSALEMIRLNLLRLHAGSVTVEGFTTHLGLAEDVSIEVERLIAARAEVEATLRFPHVAEPTPV